MDRIESLKNIAIFAYNNGLVVIPLKNKVPILKGWNLLENNYEQDQIDINNGLLPKNIRRIEKMLSNMKYDINYSIPNIGILTGKNSGIVVIDIDVKNGGVEKWNSLILKYGNIPLTFIVSTPSGGYHLYFKYTDDLKNIGNINSLINIPIDFRTDSGMIVFVGSKNNQEKEYKIYTGINDNKNMILSEMPIWLKRILVIDRMIKYYKVQQPYIIDKLDILDYYSNEIINYYANVLGVRLY